MKEIQRVFSGDDEGFDSQDRDRNSTEEGGWSSHGSPSQIDSYGPDKDPDRDYRSYVRNDERHFRVSLISKIGKMKHSILQNEFEWLLGISFLAKLGRESEGTTIKERIAKMKWLFLQTSEIRILKRATEQLLLQDISDDEDGEPICLHCQYTRAGIDFYLDGHTPSPLYCSLFTNDFVVAIVSAQPTDTLP